MSDYVIRKDENGNEVRVPLPLEEYVILTIGDIPYLRPEVLEWQKWINPSDDPENVFMHPNTWFTLSNGVRIIYQKSENGIEGCYTLASEDVVGELSECMYTLLKIPQIGPNTYSEVVWVDMCERKGIFKCGKLRNGFKYIPTGYTTFHMIEE